jgi:hypothetical protein
VDSLRYAVQAENGNAHPRSMASRHGITPEHGDPLIFVTPTLLGEEKLSLPNAPQSCCVAVSCPWLIAAPVERASALQY